MARRPTSLRRRLTVVLVTVGAVSVLLLASTVTVLARSLLEESARNQLTSVRNDRRAAVERGVADIQANVAAMAAAPSVVAALDDLDRGWDSLAEELTPPEQESLSASAQSAAGERADFDTTASPTDWLPRSPAGRRAHYLYVAENPFPADQRARLDDAGDGSDYSAAHARHHPTLRRLREVGRGSDLLLVSAATGEVVYSVAKLADFGVDTTAAPWDDTGLRGAVELLASVPAGDAVVVDGTRDPAAGLAPTVYFAAGVRSGSEVVGALAMPVPLDRLTALVTANADWDLLGLGSTGQAVVVGADGTLRTEPRTWLDDPQDHLSRLATAADDGDLLAEEVGRAGTPVLVQPVTGPAVEAALGGDDYVGRDTDALGGRTLAAATPIDVGGLGWVLVAEQSAGESSRKLVDFLTWVGLLLAVLLPLIVVAGVMLSRALTRPIPALLAMSRALAEGDLDVVAPDLGSNEFGDLAHQLDEVADDLRRQRGAAADEEARIRGILSAVVPARLMERVRRGERDVANLLETATVVSASLTGALDPSDLDHETVLEFTSRVTGDLERLAVDHGVEAGRAAARQVSFLAGLGTPGPDVEAAAAFATSVSETVRAAGRDFGLDVDATVGVSSGAVGTGLLGSSQPAFGMWGDPPGRAAALDGLARPGEVLVDSAVANALADGWTTTPIELEGLADDVDAHVLVRDGAGLVA